MGGPSSNMQPQHQPGNRGLSNRPNIDGECIYMFNIIGKQLVESSNYNVETNDEYSFWGILMKFAVC